MNAAEMQRRVDAWTDSRSTFPRDAVTPSAMWDACSGSFGATSAPALGCLLALVREAWGQRVTLSPISMGGSWRVGDAYGWVGKSQSSEAEALVAALEAAPQLEAVTP